MVIVGAGGQGLLTLLQILAEAALAQGYDVKTSELHGLSQRGGSVEVHLRFGKKIYSPLVERAKADLILALEMQESLSALYYSHNKTTFLINDEMIPIPWQKFLTRDKIIKTVKRQTNKVFLVEATKICQKALANKVVAGVYLVSFASFKKIIPIRPELILAGIKKIIPQKYLQVNKKAFELAKGASV